MLLWATQSIVNGGKYKSIFSKNRNKTRMSTLSTRISNTALEFLAGEIKQEKETWYKQESKLFLFVDWMFYTQKVLRTG